MWSAFLGWGSFFALSFIDFLRTPWYLLLLAPFVAGIFALLAEFLKRRKESGPDYKKFKYDFTEFIGRGRVDFAHSLQKTIEELDRLVGAAKSH